MKKWKLPKRILAAALAGSLLLSVCAFAQDSQETTAISGESETSVLTDEQVSGGTGTAVLADGQDSGSKDDRPFTDVQDETQYYYTPVYWGYDLGVTKGTSETLFSPSDTCTRAQFVTFLYRLAGEPDVSGLSTDFTDLNSAEYYYNAVLWADANGITEGKTSTTFAPGDAVSREEVVTFLYRYAGGSYSNNPFTDIVADNYAYEAILWAYENGITLGTSATTFSPKDLCTRAMTITFLYRMYMLENGEDETLVTSFAVNMNGEGTLINDEVYDELYAEGSASEGILAIIEAGNFVINGFAMPGTEEDYLTDWADTGYLVNAEAWVTQNEDGTWTTSSNKAAGPYDTVAEACLAILTVSDQLNGQDICLYDTDGDGYVDAIELTYVSAIIVNAITDNGDGTYSVDSGYIAANTVGTEKPYDGDAFNADSDWVVKAENFDDAIELGDVAIFYYGTDGWVLTRALEITGVLTEAVDHDHYTIGTTEYGDAMKFSRDNLVISNRNGEYANAYMYFGMDELEMEVSLWLVPTTNYPTSTGAPIGITSSDASASLTEALSQAQAKLDSVVVSTEEEAVSLEAGTLWVTQEVYDELEAAIDRASQALESETRDDLLDYQVYLLYLTLHGSADDIGASFAGYNYEGFDNQINTAEATTVSIDNDGSTTITDAAYDAYFETTAAEGVEALLNAGACYVNGIQVPASADEVEDGVYYVDGVESLYLTDEGWGYNVHKTTSLGNDTFDVARLAFYETLTTVRGHVTKLTLDEDGNVERIDVDSYEVVLVNDIVDNGDGTVTIQRGEFDLETARVRVDIETISFPAENVDSSIEIGDIAYYYYGPDGWVITCAIPVVGTVTKDSDGAFVVTMSDGNPYTSMESNVSRYNLCDAGRPTQFYNQTYTRLGLTDLEVNVWCTPNGYPIGFTFADPEAALTAAIAVCKEALEGVVAAEDEEDVPAGTLWAWAEDIEAFEAAIAEAEALAADEDATAFDYSWGIYELGQAYGTDGSSPSGFIGSLGTGTGAADVTLEAGVYTVDTDGSTKITDSSFDQYFEGTAAEGVEALLNAGACYVNGIQVPVTAPSTSYQVNGVNSLYETDEGWGYNVHKTTSLGNDTFDVARMGFFETISTVLGHEIEITIGEDGVTTKIDISSYEAVLIESINWYNESTQVSRGDFELETSRVRLDINDWSKVVFYTPYVASAYATTAEKEEVVLPGMVAYYWYGIEEGESKEGWHLEVADAVVGTLSKNEAGEFVVTQEDGTEYASLESNVSRYTLYDAARSAQVCPPTSSRLSRAAQRVERG
ncbi:MAG: S-layer homology domain-containing protein, partial [Clostridiales bacterium]|nr:S-layer homology domain-containing protein [Clostridiales bacterium]